jgi:hypothetical protein
MAEQRTFSVNGHPLIRLEEINGSLTVVPWEQPEILVEATGELPTIDRAGNALKISGVIGDLTLHIPLGSRLFHGPRAISDLVVARLSGHVSIERARNVTLSEIGGSVHLKDCEGDLTLRDVQEAAEIRRGGGDLQAERVATLRVYDGLGGDVRLSAIERAQLDNVGGDVQVRQLRQRLQVGNISGDCQVEDSPEAEILIGNVGGDLRLASLLRLRAGNVGGDVELRAVRETSELGNIGGDLLCSDLSDALRVGHVGGDARLQNISAPIDVEAIGGDLRLTATFPAGSRSHLHVGGDAEVELREPVNLSIHATIGGELQGAATFTGRGGMLGLTYGDGSATLQLLVGGDLLLKGESQPRSWEASPLWSWSWPYHLERELGRFAREMGRFGQELGQEIARAAKELQWQHPAPWKGKARFFWKHHRGDAAQARATVLRMIATGRLSPEEGDLLLRHLDL